MTAHARRTPPHAFAAKAAVHRLDARALGHAAVLALYDELALAPKPGLVSFEDAGSHGDMDAHTFMRSLFTLRHDFVRLARLGETGAAFAELKACGIAAETRMLAATGGVNTHRGAIFTLGLLCASAGALGRADMPLQAHRLRETLQRRWGPALAAKAAQTSLLPGGQAARRHGLRGAAAEAAAGFPVLFEVAAPTLARGLARGDSPQHARVDTLFAVMAELDDSNLVHRGGMAALRDVQGAAREFMAAGGAAAPGGIARARTLHHALMARRLSPGGAADLLAAACWLARIGALPAPAAAMRPEAANATLAGAPLATVTP
ncbi:triphosphoribosyl-dephospho-CoA synthase MdcB [Achromobacter sp. GG226]|uniref:triphosphoribosyl-dephospho-CoA synthase MdcB n=1 Tax=Verticiella alkaliphila TaxID=2779529 RepID=UPI001C0B3932|nr:triphosphoribosyl-dephospho-CoA synthase MdcB [Verticiella sp. GG226]MBU4609600.1 triphosphoribosyl-dephospho-CoA synthase MdcB [Verticiella sp. GG226]